jgi:hypothetical protein
MGQILYHLMKSPPYVFQEYPKVVDGKIINGPEEEIAEPVKRKPGRPRKADP